ncbi:ABC-2 family transporter protein [Clostridioides sp. ES-S-0108-01]|uniref:ABC transporter permease n=1 Tax=Clostridioides sp. ES-S-0108-01 TaxID=2770773 RepID=UPI0028899DCB|nr:ABC-2 family transporter protein [Clostridioides sp. ES-S-0108-01]UDN50939.1 ABC-2 family transporter protein [Clostridioides sp. ES-S-0107-01]
MMKKNFKIIFMLLKMKLSKMMVFRFDFFGGFFVDSSLFILQLLMFNSIYSHVDSIGGWQRGEMLIFIGTFSLINAINMTIFCFGIYDIPRKIQEGELDYYITKPINPLFRLTFENISIGSSPLIFASILIVIYGISELNSDITFVIIIAYICMVLLMTLLFYDICIIFRTISFFVISSTAIMRLEDNLIPMNMKIPGVIYEGVFKLLFYLILPYGIMSTIPTQILAGTLTIKGLVYSICIVFVFTVFMWKFWKLGMRHYKSASS